MTPGHNTVCKCPHADLGVNTCVSVPYDSRIDLSENWEFPFLIAVGIICVRPIYGRSVAYLSEVIHTQLPWTES
jgi:hypothetical protein